MKKTNIIFCLSLLAVFIAQLIFTNNSFGQIRYEELAESVRNVFWLENKTIYDGISSNVGWYGTLLFVYNIFGFQLFGAKIFRLILQFISLICLSLFLKKTIGIKNSLVPLITIGLSPTLLFFNTLQTSYGLDLQYLPICLFLISSLNFKKVFKSIFIQIILFLIMMIAWLSYPAFIYYLPSLTLYYLYKTHQASLKSFLLGGNLLLSLVFFLLPLVLVFIYIQDNWLLIYDPIEKSGLFRGAGTFYFNSDIFFKNLAGLLTDLFAQASGYYYEVSSTEFSGGVTLISVILVLGISIKLFFIKKFRFAATLIWTILLLSLIISSFTFDPSGKPGIRRYTPILASFYALFTLGWYYLSSKTWSATTAKKILLGVFIIIPLHHLISFPINLSHIKDSSPYRYSYLFEDFGKPDKSLSRYISLAQKEDIKLICQKLDSGQNLCRYQEMYAAITGSCLWNYLNCHQILGFDSDKNQYIPLNINLWKSYYFPH